MSARAPGQRSLGRLFATHAAITLIPVLILGLVLAAGYRSEARQRGLAVGKSEALLVAQTAVEPILDGRPLSAGLTPAQTAELKRLVATSCCASWTLATEPPRRRRLSYGGGGGDAADNR